MKSVRITGGEVGTRYHLTIEGIEYEQRVDAELAEALGLRDDVYEGDPTTPAVPAGTLTFTPDSERAEGDAVEAAFRDFEIWIEERRAGQGETARPLIARAEKGIAAARAQCAELKAELARLRKEREGERVEHGDLEGDLGWLRSHCHLFDELHDPVSGKAWRIPEVLVEWLGGWGRYAIRGPLPDESEEKAEVVRPWRVWDGDQERWLCPGCGQLYPVGSRCCVTEECGVKFGTPRDLPEETDGE